ncbi:hypothetical protein BCV70DRAFT_232360 [Testicularia cyperi]|uniref:Uncharacterized protein n=1 Tax=Testicularia cyperi TaxID=1882483 RepID=A0A317XM93_9BASI|nr:hypothetical protein BCV70DRAFT_232360 [Testicularia cyperi]
MHGKQEKTKPTREDRQGADRADHRTGQSGKASTLQYCTSQDSRTVFRVALRYCTLLTRIHPVGKFAGCLRFCLRMDQKNTSDRRNLAGYGLMTISDNPWTTQSLVLPRSTNLVPGRELLMWGDVEIGLDRHALFPTLEIDVRLVHAQRP